MRAHYFVNPPSVEAYAELFAEQFSILDNGVGDTQGQFTMTDNTIGNNRLRCTMHMVTSYWHTDLPVGPNNPHVSFKSFPQAWGCPAVTEDNQEGA